MAILMLILMLMLMLQQFPPRTSDTDHALSIKDPVNCSEAEEKLTLDLVATYSFGSLVFPTEFRFW